MKTLKLKGTLFEEAELFIALWNKILDEDENAILKSNQFFYDYEIESEKYNIKLSIRKDNHNHQNSILYIDDMKLDVFTVPSNLIYNSKISKLYESFSDMISDFNKIKNKNALNKLTKTLNQ